MKLEGMVYFTQAYGQDMGYRTELNQYIGKSIAINRIAKRDIKDIPINNCALREYYDVSNRIELKNISINRSDKISYQ